jgi:hypothetical protein
MLETKFHTHAGQVLVKGILFYLDTVEQDWTGRGAYLSLCRLYASPLW